MANNLQTGPQAMTPNQDSSFEDAGFTAENTNVIFGFQPITSFKFGRDFNTLESLEANKGVLIDMKAPLDATEFFYPGIENVTPAAPNIIADDAADTLAATHALGTGQLETSTNDGPYADYAPITVGNVARANGYYKIRTKAGVGRNPSLPALSPAFTVSGGPIHHSSFTGTNGVNLNSYVPEIGNAWVNQDGDFVLNSGQAITSGAYPAGASQWTTYSILSLLNYKATIVATRLASSYLQFHFRGNADLSNAVIVHVADTLVTMYNKVAGVYTSFGGGAGNNTALTTNNAEHSYEITINGTSITVKQDGVTIVTATIPTVQTGTKIGLATANSTTAGEVKYNDVLVEPLP